MSKTIAWAEGTFTNVTEPFTVMLTNEAQQFATDSNRKVTSAQSYYTDIIVIRGSQERTDYTIGNITSGSGITVSKNSKRVTFSVSAGATIGADTGVIEIPITLDGQTVKKQFSWSCGKQGPQGVKGQDGTSVKITSKSVTYQTSTSGTTAPTGTWLTTVPTVNNGQYLWTKTTVQYSDGNKTEAYSVSYKGTNGTNGTSVTVSKTEVTYQVSTSGTTAPTGTWQTTMPSCDQGQYLWTKTYVKYSDGKDTTSYAVSYKGVDGKKFAFNMLRGTNQGSKHWETYYDSSVDGKYSVESFVDEDGTNGVKFICTEKTSRWQYVCFIDYEMIKTLKSATKYVFSCDIKTNVKNGYIKTSLCTGSASNHFADNLATKLKGDNTWEHVVWSFTTYDPLPQVNNQIVYLSSTAVANVGETYIKNLKLTEGTVDTPWAPHPEDLEGRGVSQTVQYYLATSQASGVTSSTSGWSTDITTQKLTADKKYLWNCYQTKYSDGTSEPISTPKVIGVYGDKGQKGDNAKDLSITPSSQYFKSTNGGKTFAPNAITIKPTIQGEINFGKWQYSIDGGVSFADVVSGQKGLTISNNVLTVSKDSSLYSDAVTMVTFRAVASDSSFYDTCSIAKIYDVTDVGDGRNLLWNSNFAKTDEAITGTTNSWGVHTRGTNLVASIDTSTKHNGFNTLKTVSAANGDKNSSNDLEWFAWGISERTSDNLHSKNQNYTLSFYAKASVTTDFIVRWGYDAYGADTTRTLTTNWQKYEIKLHQATSAYSITIIFKLLTAGTVWFSEFKLEKGSSATGYSTAPEDLQTAILSTKSEIADVSLKVDKNKQAIEQRVEKTTYQQDLNLVKGDISKANEGLNKWRYEIYPKSLFTNKPEDQRKISLDVFARNKNIIPTQSILLDDTKLGYFNYDDNYIGYAVTFVKMSEATKLETTFVHDDVGSFYLNGKLICTNGKNNFYSSATPDTVSCTLVKGWNCLEVVINEDTGSEGFKFGTVLSQLSTCQLMNCYYAMVTGRESQITNTLVQNTIDIEGVGTKVGKVTSVIGENGENFSDFKNDYSDFKQTMNGFKTTVGQTYVTKDDFNGLEIGGRNLLLYSQTIRAHNNYYDVGCLTDEVETFNGCPVWSVKNRWGRLVWLFKSHVIDRGLVKVGDTLTYSLYAKTNNASGKSISCSYRFKGNAQAYWFKGSAFNIGTSWARYSATFTVTKDMLATDTYMNEIGFEETASMSGDDKVYYACPKLERGTKATDYTPAPEDNEINGQNLVSNLPSNWEQGSINYTANLAYGSLKSTLVSRLRTKDVFPVSGNITISAGTSTNSSKEELNFYYVLFDINKKSISHGDTWQSLTSPKIINCGNAKYMAIILRWGSGSTAITPSDISKICLKIERGTSATPFTLAPEDVNGKIVNVETIANQTAKKFEWIVKGGDSSSNFTLTDRVADLVAERINFKGLVTFSGLNTDAKNEIGKVAQSKVDGLEVGGRNLLKRSSMIGEKLVCDNYFGCNNCDTKEYTNEGFHIITPTEGNANNGIAFSFDNFTILGINGGDTITFSCDIKGTSDSHAPFVSIHISDNNWYGSDVIQQNTGVSITKDWQRVSVTITTPTGLTKNHMWLAIHGNYQSDLYVRNFKLEKGNKATDWTPALEDVSQDATNKASQALTDAKNYSSNAVKWVTNNGASTTNLNSMVKKWTDGAVSDTTQINGGWIKANTITANKIAIGDFTNYADDPDFENGLYSPTGTFSLSTEQKYVGTKSLKMASGTVAYYGTVISPQFYLEKDEEIYVEYYVYRNGANHPVGVCVEASASNYGSVVYDISGQKMASANITDKTWTKISYVGKANRSGMWHATFKHSSNTTLTGDWYLDHVTIRKRATGNLIVDGSITADKIAANAITADKIATDAIKSRNYISSGGTQGSFLNLSDGSFTTPNLSWDLNGNLIAKNANLSGEITATTGSIGKYKITDQWLITGSGSTASGFGGNQAFWAGSSSSNDAPFRVGYNGKLYANGATISGDITATTGKIGDLTLKDGILTGTGSYSEPYTEDDDGTVTSTITTNYITKLFGKGLTIDSTVKYSDEDDVYSYKVSVLPDEISFTDGEEIGMLGAGGLRILQVNDNSDSYSSEANEVSLSSGASNFYYTTPVNQTTDKYLHVCFSADGASFMASQGDKFNSFDIGYSSAKYSGNFAANKFVYTGNSLNYVECLEANDTTNVYFHSNGYYSFRVNNEGNWSNETQSVYITERGISVPGQIGLYSQEMSNYVARYYIAGSTKCTAIGNGSYNTRIYGSSVWTQKAVSTSDVRLKQDFQPLDKFEDLYMNLQPVSFKYIDGYDKSEDRYFGLKAQPTEKLFEDMGENPDDYAMFNKFGIDHEDIKERLGHDVDFDEEHGLDYTNMIALNTHMVQKTRREAAIDHREIEILKAENAELKATLQAIMTKLNMQQN